MHDLSALRWAIVAVYAAAALLCAMAGLWGAPRERRLWLVSAALLIILGFAKLTQLQQGVTARLRGLFKARGWYGAHVEAQGVFIVAMLACACIAAIIVARRLRGCSALARIAALGLAALLLFTLVRAVSLHAIDTWTVGMVAGMRRGWWVELGAVALIGASALGYSVEHARDSEQAD